MACFFIDYENLCGNSLESIAFAELKKSDELIIFYSRNASKLTFEFHRDLEKIKAKKEYIMTEVGAPNALDFQLSSYLGAYVYKYPEKEFYIVSKDKGFDRVCHFWQSRNIYVNRINSFYDYVQGDVIKRQSAQKYTKTPPN